MPPFPSIDSITFISNKSIQDSSLCLIPYLCKYGLENHKSFCNPIVSMFVGVRSMHDLQIALNKMECKSKHLWNMLITRFIDSGKSRHALIMYKKFQGDMLKLSGSTYIELLKACVELKDLDTGCQIHDDIQRDSLLQNDIIIGNKLVDLYAKCDSILKAREVFDELAYRDVVSWNSLISGYLRHKHGNEAMSCFEEMLLDGFAPNAITVVHCMKACVIAKNVFKGRQVHSETIIKGLLEKDTFVGNALVDMYAKLGLIEDAQGVFDKLAVHDVISWTALISGYLGQEKGKQALDCFEQMGLEGVSPNAHTYVCVLKACGSIGCRLKGVEVHDEVVKDGLLESNILVGNALIDMYAKCGLPAKALEVFKKLPIQDVISWNVLLGGYLHTQCDKEALHCFRKMQVKGMSPDVITFVYGLQASGSLGAIDVGIDIHGEVVRKGLLAKDVVIGNAIVDMYAKCGFLDKAREVFSILPSKTVVSWTSLIAEYARLELADEALSCFQQMQCSGFSPNSVTFACCLKACGLVMEIETGRGLHADIERQGLLEGDLNVGNELIAMYAKCGFLKDAQDMLDRLPLRNVVSWNALIVGYVLQEHGAAALNCFDKMQINGISPNDVTFAFALKACDFVGDVAKAKDLHAMIVQRGLFQSDPSVGNALVGLYARFGMLEEAQIVFHMVSVQDEMLWTSLIAGYTKHNYPRKALLCFEQMLGEGVSPSPATLVCVLKACGSVGDFDKGSVIHAEIARTALMETDLAVGNALVNMYAKCRLLAKAQEVFDKLSVRDIITWNVLITGYADHELKKEALIQFERMQQEGVQPNAVTFICALNACGCFEAIRKSIEMHSEIARRGLLNMNDAVGSALVNVYAQCGLLAKAHEVLDHLPVRDVISWTALVGGYARIERGEAALVCYKQMQLEGFLPNAITHICILKACGSVGAQHKGREIHAEIAFEGMLMSDLAVGNALVHMYAKCGSLATAQEVLDKLPLRDTISWNALIAEHSRCGFSEDVLSCYEQMQLEGVPPNAVTFACSLKACAYNKAVDRGQKIHVEVLKMRESQGVHSMVCNALVSMYVSCGLLSKALEVFKIHKYWSMAMWTELVIGCAKHAADDEAMHYIEQMLLEGIISECVTSLCSSKTSNNDLLIDVFQKASSDMADSDLPIRNLYVGSALVGMFAKRGSFQRARKVFDMLTVRDVVLWTALMAGYVKHDYIEEAMNCYDQMQLEGVSLDSAAFVHCLKACGSIGALQKGREVHTEISRMGLLGREPFIGNALVDMYAKCGSLEKAQDVFDQLPGDVVTWTSLINGHVQSGENDRVFTIFETMKRRGTKPDAVTFLKVLDACCRADVLDKAQLYLEMMQKEYDVSPSVEHYNCMLDLLGRAGDIQGAQAIIKEMPVYADLVAWRTILGACQRFGHADLGTNAFSMYCLKMK